MFSPKRTLTLLVTCLLAALVAAPAAAVAAPAEEEYVLDLPSAGSEDPGAKGRGGKADERTGGVPAAAADSADEGGLPVLLVILAGTALAGASIAIMRRQKS